MHKGGGKISGEKEFDALLSEAFLELDFDHPKNKNILESTALNVTNRNHETSQKKNSADKHVRIQKRLRYIVIIMATIGAVIATYYVYQKLKTPPTTDRANQTTTKEEETTEQKTSTHQTSDPTPSNDTLTTRNTSHSKITTPSGDGSEKKSTPLIKKASQPNEQDATPEAPLNEIDGATKKEGPHEEPVPSKETPETNPAGSIKSIRETFYTPVENYNEKRGGKNKKNHLKWEVKFYIIYETNGDITEKKIYNPDGSASTLKTGQYDDKGQLSGNDYIRPDEHSRKNYTFQYEYDKHHNWTKYTRYLDNEPIDYIERAIEYY